MNELKAQLIKSMQTDLDELKRELSKLSPQEILGRAYEYAMKTEIIYAAHDSVLDDHQIEALLKHPSPLNDVYSKYLKHDETSLSDELANCLVEEADIELHHNENTDEKRHEEYSDAFFVNNEHKCVVWMYYNPDSNAGGQYVTNIISFDKLAKISSENHDVDDYFNKQISSVCTQYLSDIGTDDYMAAEKMFRDNPDFINITYTTMQALTKIAMTNEWENELHNDLPSFIKSAFAWDELIGYGSIDDEIQYEETPVKVVRDFFLKEKGISNLGFEFDEDSHRAMYIEYLNVCTFVSDGVHSLSIAHHLKQGKITARLVDITVIFPYISTDGAYWYVNGDRYNEYLAEDYRFCLIYEIAKLKYKLENKENYDK